MMIINLPKTIYVSFIHNGITVEYCSSPKFSYTITENNKDHNRSDLSFLKVKKNVLVENTKHFLKWKIQRTLSWWSKCKNVLKNIKCEGILRGLLTLSLKFETSQMFSILVGNNSYNFLRGSALTFRGPRRNLQNGASNKL